MAAAVLIASAAANAEGFAVDDYLSTPMNTRLTVPAASLLANDLSSGQRLRLAAVGRAVNGKVSVGTGGMITFEPKANLRDAAQFSYTVVDSAGEESTAVVRVAVAATASLWPLTAKPEVITDSDRNSVELGVRFTSRLSGTILGIRFYKGPLNTGSHPVSLWTAGGTRLATATSADETASGWQEVRFAKPVAITAGRTYIASYHSGGRYSATPAYFSSSRSNGPLVAPASTASAGNGVYAYGTTPRFPTQTWNASNYWVDVILQTDATADVTPPTTPTGFTARAATNRIDLAWGASTDNVSVPRYRLVRDGASLTTTTATTYSDAGLNAATTYRYSLTALDDAGNVSPAVTAAATTPASSSTSCRVALGDGATLGGNLPFPADNPWNQDISGAPVDPNSALILSTTNLTTRLHADFGSGTYGGIRIGYPYIVVAETQPLARMVFTAWPLESDPGPYPFPPNAPIEGFGATGYNDRHVLVVQRNCAKPNQLDKLFETFGTYPVGNYPVSVDYWRASNGAVFDLTSNALRPAGWTSADAAGLPIFPGLVRYDEVAAGEIRHALRFSLAPGYTRKAYVAPARHWASSNTGAQYAPFGMRVRLKASTDISGLPARVQVIARAMKKYGMFVADNGGNWFVSGAADERWNNDELAWLGYLTARDFEVVKMGTIVTP